MVSLFVLNSERDHDNYLFRIGRAIVGRGEHDKVFDVVAVVRGIVVFGQKVSHHQCPGAVCDDVDFERFFGTISL